MRIYFASDHAGFNLKNKLISYVKDLGFNVVDCGSYKYNKDDDYPDYIKKASQAVSENSQKSLGIILGGSGEGEAIVANKYAHVRATVYYGGNQEIIKLSREHNDANVLSIGAKFVKEKEAKKVVKDWLLGQYSVAHRHKRRIEKIKDLENKTIWQRLFRL